MAIVTNSQLHTIHNTPVMTSVFIFRFSDVISTIADHPKQELELNGKKFVKTVETVESQHSCLCTEI
jgi:hypothetical protein